jgi:hypothetical protein
MSKYDPLEQHLSSLTADTWQASFADIEALLGFPLPASARQYSAWWANNHPGSRHTSTWLKVGWHTADLDIPGERVTFRRAKGVTATASSAPHSESSDPPGTRFASALAYAALIHAKQRRKGAGIPYISHLMCVSALVMEYGSNEDQAIAGLLHDSLEDCGAWHEPVICEQFGDRVADIVVACTDGVPGADGMKPPWRARKERYLAHLETAGEDVLLVAACDKLHNARAIAADLDAGHDVFARFNPEAGRDGTLWYYNELVRVFRARMGEDWLPVRTLAGAVARISLSASPKSRSG